MVLHISSDIPVVKYRLSAGSETWGLKPGLACDDHGGLGVGRGAGLENVLYKQVA